MRVITGSAGGLHLQVPKGVPLRPTQDRIRQVIFSSLGERVIGARVLDLFAGTGALAIEALSRGAASATLVEKEKKCVEVIQNNLTHCRLTAQLVRDDVHGFLKKTPVHGFDLIFADPPYDKVKQTLLQDPFLASIQPWLNPGGLFVLEHFSGQSWAPQPGWDITRQRHYGETGLTFWQHKTAA